MTEQIDQLATALAAAQAGMPNAAFNRVNPHFKSRYADLAAIRDASLPHLAKHGLAIVQFTTVSTETGAIHLHTKLIHKSGQSIEGAWPIAQGTPQQMGSALTYAKRYGWASMIGMTADDDDDANAAETAKVPAMTAGMARKDGAYPKFEKEIRECASLEDLQACWRKWNPSIKGWPATYVEYAEEEKERAKARLSESPVKKQLKASLEAENVGQ